MVRYQHPHAAVVARPTLDPASLKAFVDPLPVPIPASKTGERPSPRDPQVKLPYYRIAIHPIEQQVHRDLKPTLFWAYGSSIPGPLLETRSGEGMLVEWANELPQEHFLPIDHNLHGAEAHLPQARTVVHLHGAKAPPVSDGYPENWYGPGKSAIYHYPNQQEAAMLWYHDHTMGINRLNTYAGMVGVYLIRDAFEDALNLPAGAFEVPLVLLDRLFTPDGQLYYPVSADPKNPWIPELFGNAFLVNGKLLPFLEVEPRRYRFRVLNASNGRFYHLSLDSGQAFSQIGVDQGLLAAPVQSKLLTLAPGERADVVVDFAGHSKQEIVLKNDALPLMQFRVLAKAAAPDSSSLPAKLRAMEKIPESAAVRTRLLTLEEVDDLLSQPVKLLLNGQHWNMPVTENPTIDTVEIWSLVNLTDDSHPIHLHLVRFQILDRRSFDTNTYIMKGTILHTGPAVLPDPTEAGWKDTVRADPGMITRFIVRFEGYTGRYVWHCHILEHEDNEMMRPYEILPAPKTHS